MDNQWFYIRQWKRHAWERLLEFRTVRVTWDTENSIDDDMTLPRFVTLPEGINLTNEGISNYLSDTYGWCVLDWSVARGNSYEA